MQQILNLLQEEVDRILYEITAGELGKAPSAVKDTLSMEPEIILAGAEGHAIDYDEMRARLEFLKNWSRKELELLYKFFCGYQWYIF